MAAATKNEIENKLFKLRGIPLKPGYKGWAKQVARILDEKDDIFTNEDVAHMLAVLTGWLDEN